MKETAATSGAGDVRQVSAARAADAGELAEPVAGAATLALLELIQRLGGEVRVPASALTGWPEGQTLVVEQDPLTGDCVFRLTPSDLEARVAKLLQALI